MERTCLSSERRVCKSVKRSQKRMRRNESITYRDAEQARQVPFSRKKECECGNATVE